MAGQTVANLSNVLKEVWTADSLAKQFYDETPWLDRLEKTPKYTIGDHASVPLQTGRGGATTVLGSAGGNLNPVSYQKTAKGTYTLAYNWAQVQLEFGALNQANGGTTSVVEAKLLEVEGAVADLRKDVTRQAFADGTAKIAQCGTTSGSTTVTLATNGYEYESLVRGFLRPDQTIDIFTPGSSDSAVSNGSAVQIQSVVASSATPQIVINGSGVTTSSSHYVKITGARTGNSAINEMTGLRSHAGSTTAIVGGIDPASNAYWQPAIVDTATTAMTLDLPLKLQQNVFQQTGAFPTDAVTGIKQLTSLYSVLQNQVRFTGDIVSAGNVLKLAWNGMNIEAYPDASDREWYFISPKDMLIVTGEYSTPMWASSVEGAGGQFRWKQGATAFTDALVYPLALAFRRRNSFAAATGLTA